MKKYFGRIVFALALMLSLSAAASAQIVVKIRPSEPVYTRPVAPSHRHVWVEGEYVPRGGRYEYVQGHWAVPRRGYHVWIRGHWVTRRSGYYWVPGHWAR